MNLRKASAAFSLIVGFSIVLIRLILLIGGDGEVSDSLSSTPIEMGMHIAVELITASVLIVVGLGLLAKKDWSKTWFFFGMGLLTYSVISAAGFYGQRGDYVPAGVFVGILGLNILCSILVWKTDSSKYGEVK
ncbi:hypothetical protein KGY77_09475 [Candidatus Bipolaricaulota bacterium]|nr:hypothetical protein [Candidatus Bipolaricaulota bacterium]MBS3792859.1 hypothetical protein [Candidatus Bipolaricaulota bacterium]